MVLTFIFQFLCWIFTKYRFFLCWTLNTDYGFGNIGRGVDLKVRLQQASWTMYQINTYCWTRTAEPDITHHELDELIRWVKVCNDQFVMLLMLQKRLQWHRFAGLRIKCSYRTAQSTHLINRSLSYFLRLKSLASRSCRSGHI